MVRIKTNVYSHKRKKRVLKEARGQFGDRSKRYKEAAKSLTASKQYAYFDRKKNGSAFRSLWIVRLNAACREGGMAYSKFIRGLKGANIELDRKMLSEIAIASPEVFTQLIEKAKAGYSTPIATKKAVVKAPKQVRVVKAAKAVKVAKAKA